MILPLLQSRRSIRKFRAAMPPRETLEHLIEAAIAAPSASNKQPWRFLVVTSADVKDRMAAAVGAAIERVAAHVEPDFENAFRAYGDYFTRFTDAPVVIVLLYRPLTLLSSMVDDALSTGDRQNIVAMEHKSGLVSASLALQNLLLMAHDSGLGASGLTGPLIAADALHTVLDAPAGWDIAAFAAVGYPDEEPPAPRRKSGADVTRWIV